MVLRQVDAKPLGATGGEKKIFLRLSYIEAQIWTRDSSSEIDKVRADLVSESEIPIAQNLHLLQP